MADAFAAVQIRTARPTAFRFIGVEQRAAQRLPRSYRAASLRFGRRTPMVQITGPARSRNGGCVNPEIVVTACPGRWVVDITGSVFIIHGCSRSALFFATITIYVLSDDLSWRPSNPATVAEAEYSSKIVGDWQGRVEGTNEAISFGADGGFVSAVQPKGFIGRTLGQGVTGTIRGNWAIKGKSITLNVSNAKEERLLNNVTIATIETFKPDELIVKSSAGDNSTFIRR
jgi:hypothetical protein